MPTSADLTRAARRRATTTTFTITIAMALLAACGGDDTTAEQRRPSVGAIVAPPAAPSVPDDDPDGPEGPDAVNGSGGFADFFGPPTDRLDGAPTTVPPTVPPAEPPAAPPTAPPAAPPTAPPAAPPTAPPAVPSDTTGSIRTPVAPIAPDFEQFRVAMDDMHQMLLGNDATLAPLDLADARWASQFSITILDGSMRSLPLDGGVVGTLLDVDGSVAGTIVLGDARSNEVLSAVVTLLVQLAADTELDAVAAHWDDAASADVDEILVPAADGGFWAISSTNGVVTLMKLQDASAAWVSEYGPLFAAEATLARTSV